MQQSDSESDAGMTGSGNRGWNASSGNSRVNALMRPTISSQNKVNHQTKPLSGTNLPSVLRRRGMQGAYSTGVHDSLEAYLRNIQHKCKTNVCDFSESKSGWKSRRFEFGRYVV